MKNVKAIILDVDGVIVGDRIGFNSPHPHTAVVEALKRVRQKGIPIALCTAKPHFSIQKEIQDSNLNNVHIADGGALIIDPIDRIIVHQHLIKKSAVQNLLQTFVDNGIYVEFYDQDNYYAQRSQLNDITPQHTHILQVEPIIVEDIASASKDHDVTKIMPIVRDEKDNKLVEKICKEFSNDVLLSWGSHPVAPLQFGIITTKGISKQRGAREISNSLNVSLENMLGVGDSLSDWQFIELCGYAATLENGDERLKQKVLNKGEANSFIGPSVDNNGVVEIFRYFNL